MRRAARDAVPWAKCAPRRGRLRTRSASQSAENITRRGRGRMREAGAHHHGAGACTLAPAPAHPAPAPAPAPALAPAPAGSVAPAAVLPGARRVRIVCACVQARVRTVKHDLAVTDVEHPRAEADARQIRLAPCSGSSLATDVTPCEARLGIRRGGKGALRLPIILGTT